MEKKKGLSKNLRRFFGIGDLAFTLMTQVENVFFNFFLTDIAGFSLAITTVIQTATTVIDAATAWIYGAIMNGTKPLKWGRYRSWLLITPWLVPVIYMLKYMVVGKSTTVSAIVIVAAGVISSIIWNFGYVANLALIPIVGKEAEDRAHLSATRATYNRVGSMLFSYMGLPLANALALVVTEQYKFAALAFVLGVLAAIGYNLHYKMTEGYEEQPERSGAGKEACCQETQAYENTSQEKNGFEQKKHAAKEKTSVAAMLKGLFQNRHLLCLILAELARWVANFVLAGCAMYYFKYVAQQESMLAVYLFVINVVCMVSAYFSKDLAAKFSSRMVFAISFFVLGGALLIARGVYQYTILVIVLLAVGQFGYGCIYSLSPTLFADAAIYAEYKTGEASSGWIMGLSNVPLKLSLVFRSIIINIVLAVAGFSPSASVESTTIAVKEGIANAFMLIPGVAVVIGGFLILFGFGLTKEKVSQMSKEIAQR